MFASDWDIKGEGSKAAPSREDNSVHVPKLYRTATPFSFGLRMIAAQRLGERQAATMVNCGTAPPACPLDLKLGVTTSTPPFWQFSKTREVISVTRPIDPGIPEDPRLGLLVWLLVKRTGGYDDFATTARAMGQWTATGATEDGCEAACGRKIVSCDEVSASEPSKSVWSAIEIRGVTRACGLAAAAAMAMGKAQERRAHFVCDRAAQTTASKDLRFRAHDAQRFGERRARTMVPISKAAFARPFHL